MDHQTSRESTASAIAEDDLGDDLLVGCRQIAEFLRWPPQRVYHMQKNLPIKNVGKLLTATKTGLRRHFRE